MCTWRATSACHPNSSLAHLETASWSRAFTAYAEAPSWHHALKKQNHCSMPARGEFTCKDHEDTAPEARPCLLPLAGGRNGTWVSRRQWVQSDSCPASSRNFLDVRELFECLDGRALVFKGDSLTRQLFLRIVWWLRGLPLIVEHHFHRYAAYTFNTTHDSLEVFGDKPLSIFPARGYAGPHDRAAKADLAARVASIRPGSALVLFDFEWPHLQAPPPKAAQKNVAARISGHAGPAEAPNYVAEASTFILSLPSRRHQDHVVDETLSLDAMNACGGAPHFFQRVALGVGSLGALKDDGGRIPGQRRFGWQRLIPSEQRLRFVSAEDAHFQCGFAPEWPQGPVSGWKMPPNGDCTDFLNLNAVQAMMRRVCAAKLGG